MGRLKVAAESHRCTPPMRTVTVTPPAALFASRETTQKVFPPVQIQRPYPVSSTWRCDCGARWRVMEPPAIRRGQRPAQAAWTQRSSGLWWRFKTRLGL